jgi:pyruvate,water dikinase
MRWAYYLPKTVWQAMRILFSFLIMNKLVREFEEYFDTVYSKYNAINLATETEEALRRTFKEVTEKLVVKWKVPIANDFAVMVSTGIVRRLFLNWLPGEDAYTHLYVGNAAPLISLDPSLAIGKIVECIQADKVLMGVFSSHHTPEEIVSLLRLKHKDTDAAKEFFAYITHFGDRMPGELKLESTSLGERPEILALIIQRALTSGAHQQRPTMKASIPQDAGLGFIKRHVLSFFLNWAKKSIELRENTRFKRTLIFGYARRIFIELGKKYQHDGILSEGSDIFFLTLEEVIEKDIRENSDIKNIISRRKEEFAAWNGKELPRRIETESTIPEIERSLAHAKQETLREKELKGMVVSTAKQTKLDGDIIVMKEFTPTADFNNKIVVTSHTDPGWAMVFPFIKGLIIERGGMLSHAAIIARELQIPCIVGVENATDILATTERVSLDLTTGKISVL